MLLCDQSYDFGTNSYCGKIWEYNKIKLMKNNSYHHYIGSNSEASRSETDSKEALTYTWFLKILIFLKIRLTKCYKKMGGADYFSTFSAVWTTQEFVKVSLWILLFLVLLLSSEKFLFHVWTSTIFM